MARRDEMASARDTIAAYGPGLGRTAGDPAIALASSAPWAPAETVYLHEHESLADDASAEFDVAQARAPSFARRAIPLLWAAALTIAALQHAGEVERRAGVREPSRAELEIQTRTEREIKAAWRSVGTVAAMQEAEAEPVEKQAPADGPILALGDPQDQTEAGTDELKAGAETAGDAPVDALSDATATQSDVAVAKDGAAAETESAKTEVMAARDQAQTTAVHAAAPLAEEPVAAKEAGEPRAAARHRRQLAKRGAHVRKMAPPPYTQSESGGHYTRYITIERVARAAP
jgi:hypothetical protein